MIDPVLSGLVQSIEATPGAGLVLTIWTCGGAVGSGPAQAFQPGAAGDGQAA